MSLLEKTFKIGLVGNPNSGKTTVFNALTGSHQRIGNWPGVTVERKSGLFKCQHATIEVIDLPGCYSLSMIGDTSSLDERIACEFIASREADVIVNILDASNLERNLYLTLQLIEMRVPMIIAVNMMDVAQQRGLQLLLDVLEKELGCLVVPLEANKGKGIKELRLKIREMVAGSLPCANLWWEGSMDSRLRGNDNALAQAVRSLTQDALEPWLAVRLLEDDAFARSQVDAAVLQKVSTWQQTIRTELNEDPDILLADARYRFIERLIAQCIVKKTQQTRDWTKRIDHIVLNRVLGIPIFLSVMYLMFFFSINVGGAFQDFFDMSSSTLFVDGPAHALMSLGFPAWLTALLANGVGKGINTTVTFIPVIGAMFLFLAFLEGSGYMARAAFVVDRLMRALGLPGKSFVPMIVGFGCNVPAVMATRTLENKRDRILTVMMSPFMSCGARLAIFAVFTAAFFPVGGQNVVFLLYLIGIAMAMLTGFCLRQTVLKGEPAPLVMELPPYHLPNLKTILLHAWQRLKGFLFRAGKLIVPICVIIGALNALNLDGSINTGEGDTHSLLSAVGRTVTPIFAPMGIHQDNWPATVGLVTGVLAKEVVIGTLNTLYTQVGHFASVAAAPFSFWGGLQAALSSIPANLAQLGNSFSNPVLSQAPVHQLTQSVYGVMYERFDGQAGAMAYLLFVLLYFPCVSTTAAMAREIGRRWALFSVLWTTGIAYCVAVGFYQVATFTLHPGSSFVWVAALASVLFLTLFTMRAKTV